MFTITLKATQNFKEEIKIISNNVILIWSFCTQQVWLLRCWLREIFEFPMQHAQIPCNGEGERKGREVRQSAVTNLMPFHRTAFEVKNKEVVFPGLFRQDIFEEVSPNLQPSNCLETWQVTSQSMSPKEPCQQLFIFFFILKLCIPKADESRKILFAKSLQLSVNTEHRNPWQKIKQMHDKGFEVLEICFRSLVFILGETAAYMMNIIFMLNLLQYFHICTILAFNSFEMWWIVL